MRVKICGITRREDARLAVELGAAALGFILWPESPRVVTVETARALAASVPEHVERVGVFVNAGRDEIERAADVIGLTTVQLHGDEPPGLARALLGRHAVIKAIALGETDEHPDLAMWSGVRILLDARDPRRGGTGRTIDWGRAAAIASRRDVILAGGLHPDNVAEAVRRVRPGGIDVSSGVESAPGLKDAAKLRALFDALAHVEA